LQKKHALSTVVAVETGRVSRSLINLQRKNIIRKSNSNGLLKVLGILGFLPKPQKITSTSWQNYLAIL